MLQTYLLLLLSSLLQQPADNLVLLHHMRDQALYQCWLTAGDGSTTLQQLQPHWGRVGILCTVTAAAEQDLLV